MAMAAILPVLPCVIFAPVVLVAIGVVAPLWIAALVLTATAWLVVAPIDILLRALGSSGMRPLRSTLERALHVLTHPKIPRRGSRQSDEDS